MIDLLRTSSKAKFPLNWLICTFEFVDLFSTNNLLKNYFCKVQHSTIHTYSTRTKFGFDDLSFEFTRKISIAQTFNFPFVTESSVT
jgi:hypothetical protein